MTMTTTSDPRLPALLARARAGEQEAEERLREILYEEMRRLAARHLRDQASPTLRTTELIHEGSRKHTALKVVVSVRVTGPWYAVDSAVGSVPSVVYKAAVPGEQTSDTSSEPW